MATPLPPLPASLALPSPISVSSLGDLTALTTWISSLTSALQAYDSSVRSYLAAQLAIETKEAVFRAGQTLTLSTSGGRPDAVLVASAKAVSGGMAKPISVPDWTWTGSAVRIDSIDSLTTGVDYTVLFALLRDASAVSA